LDRRFAKALIIAVAGLVCFPIVFLIEAGSGFTTPGILVARYLVRPQGLKDLTMTLSASIAFDYILVVGIAVVARRVWVKIRSDKKQSDHG